jgi:hypothetical protein
MTRRGLIRRLLLVLAVPWRAGRPKVEAAQPASPAGESPARSLSAAELDDLVAFGEVLVGPGPLSTRERGFLVDHIRYRTSLASDYYLEAYRSTVGLLKRLAGAPFASLDLPRRQALVGRYRLDAPLASPDEDLGPFPEPTRTVRTQVMGDLVGGYYDSPAGWAVVGYDAFPGRCSDLTRYTGPGR